MRTELETIQQKEFQSIHSVMEVIQQLIKESEEFFGVQFKHYECGLPWQVVGKKQGPDQYLVITIEQHLSSVTTDPKGHTIVVSIASNVFQPDMVFTAKQTTFTLSRGENSQTHIHQNWECSVEFKNATKHGEIAIEYYDRLRKIFAEINKSRTVSNFVHFADAEPIDPPVNTDLSDSPVKIGEHETHNFLAGIGTRDLVGGDIRFLESWKSLETDSFYCFRGFDEVDYVWEPWTVAKVTSIIPEHGTCSHTIVFREFLEKGSRMARRGVYDSKWGTRFQCCKIDMTKGMLKTWESLKIGHVYCYRQLMETGWGPWTVARAQSVSDPDVNGFRSIFFCDFPDKIPHQLNEIVHDEKWGESFQCYEIIDPNQNNEMEENKHGSEI